MQYKIYVENLPENTLEQFFSALEEPSVVKAALMPDAHTGYVLPIGAVVATKDKIYPSWVGYDIGCGMCAIPTTFNKKDIIKHSKEIFNRIYELIPVGFNIHETPSNKHSLNPADLTNEVQELFNKRNGFRHLGSLGGGNHFIEIGYDETNTIWIVIHSGSRGVGHITAQHYMRLASGDGKAREGHYGFDKGTKEFDNYINDLNWMLEFALQNRKNMIDLTNEAIQEYCKGTVQYKGFINRNHNHVELKDGLYIHRKGATHSDKDMMGVIPANMKEGSFIVKGKGNEDSLCSSSHGAGRVLGRRKAKDTLKLEDFENSMAGITAKVDKETIDESPKAYKDIYEVMELQKDLVDIIHHVKPLINIKG